ncbi:MAG TPA: SIS domain-containing protein [Polyangiaceae bacterium]|nr:SIS domain-containing protein [Polyangiaceae bacterium]
MSSEILLLALDVDGVLTDGSVTITPSGEEAKGIAFRDLDALARARRAGLRIALVTGEEGPLVMAIAAKAGAEFVLPAAKDKVAALEALSANAAVPLGRICFVGDADRDALAFPMVGISLCPANGSRAARRTATRVLTAKGGAGAVEEAVEILLADSEEGDLRPGFENTLRRIAEDSLRAHEKLIVESMPTLAEIAAVVTRALKAGRRVLFCGNGGSAADAQHVAAELVGRFALEREPFPALALTTDTSILTAVGNDWDFKDIFSRQVRAHARPGDVVVGISTSGKSANVVRALEVARECGAVTIAFTGRNGGAVAKAADHSFKAPDAATPRVQELHLLAWHGICEVVEAAMVSRAELEKTGT